MKQLVIPVIFGLFLFLLFSFQFSTNNSVVDALKEKALEFELNQQFDSAAFYFAKARALADKSNVKESRQAVLEAEINFWVNRSDKNLNEVKRQLHLLWAVYNTDAKFRINYYEAKSILFLENSVPDSFDYFYDKTVDEIKSSGNVKDEITYYSYVAQRHIFNDDLLGAKKYEIIH